MNTLVIVEINSVFMLANQLINNLKFGTSLCPKILIEYILLFLNADTTSNQDDFDLNFWAYIETILSDEQLQLINPSEINIIIDIVFSNIKLEIKQSLGVENTSSLEFVHWIGNDACFYLDNSRPIDQSYYDRFNTKTNMYSKFGYSLF